MHDLAYQPPVMFHSALQVHVTDLHIEGTVPARDLCAFKHLKEFDVSLLFCTLSARLLADSAC